MSTFPYGEMSKDSIITQASLDEGEVVLKTILLVQLSFGWFGQRTQNGSSPIGHIRLDATHSSVQIMPGNAKGKL
jgi:hypothetical protein